jgi:hypothetical protein
MQAEIAPTPEPYLASVIRDAVKAGNVDMVERLLAMQHREEERQAKRDFEAAIAQAKGEIEPILKTAEVDFENTKGTRTRYKHETLADVRRNIDPALAKYGLSARFHSHQREGMLKVVCVLSHSSGHSENAAELEAPYDPSGSKNPVQAIGSTATYLQRMTLKLALGLAAADKDDDGRASSSPLIDPYDIAYLEHELATTESDKAKFLEAVGAPSIERMTVEQLKKGLGMIERKKAKAAP